VVFGVAAGALVATVLGLGFGSALSLAGRSPDVVLAPAVLVGFVAGGFVAGRTTSHAFRFHGSAAGLAMAGLVVVVAFTGGSPATLGQVLLLALLAIAGGGAGGTLGGKHRRRHHPAP
jgi:putative membrane protein (TIGR04086 family)